ncbi:SIMPL domain-containing protein [Tsukamurella serpentis]
MVDATSNSARTLRRTGAALLMTISIGAATVACGSSGGDAPREITAAGTGQASGKPDVLTVELAVAHQAPDVSSALNEASSRAQQVTGAAAANGVDAKDITTANVRVSPRYGPDRAISSYEATQALTLKVRKLDTASKLLGDLATAGGDATRINSVGFDVENDSTLKATARDKAFAEAKARAEQYAELAGGKLAEVRTVTEGAPVRPAGAQERSSLPASGAAPVPIQAGDQTLSVTVTVVWRLAD